MDAIQRAVRRTSNPVRKIRRKLRNEGKPYPPVPVNSGSVHRAWYNIPGKLRDYFFPKFPTNEISTSKYTVLNFIPKNLYEQFHRMTNIYFLIIVIITLIPAISPLTPWTSILPLIFVLGVTCIKEGYEDLQRHVADGRVNFKKYRVLKSDGSFKKKRSCDLRVGEIIKIHSDQNFPADVVPIITSLDDGICFVETAQLDGETNLKMYKAPPVTNGIELDQLSSLRGTLFGERTPNHQLYKFDGTLSLDGFKEASLNKDNLLLRGATLRNTEWVIGIVLYTGKFTKLSLNQKLPPSKFSTVESRLNKSVIAIFLFKLSCVIVLTIGSAVFNATLSGDMWFLDVDVSPAFQATKDFFSYFALLSFMIPMSLMVTLEVVKVIQGKFMEWDKKMRVDPEDPESGMAVKTTNLNDELALVKYVFSDKTGTLTENRMEFQKVSINGIIYEQAGLGELKEELEAGCEENKAIYDFLVNLGTCHAVVPDINEETGEIDYKAQSPDEVALANGARVNGVVFKARTQVDITVDILGEEYKFDVLNILEFTSDRRRMSVILRMPESMGGGIRIYTKGADSKVKELLADHGELEEKTYEDIEVFSNIGLRTLLLAYRDISEEEYNEWEPKFHAAEIALENRDAEIEKATEMIECKLHLQGATAIEDRLQDEVPETIHNLLRSGINVWVITGDKLETAKNIGYSCKLLKKDMTLLTCATTKESLTRESSYEILRSFVDMYCARPREKTDPELALIIDGDGLTFALVEHKELFLQITSLCQSVICCRVTPLQKAEVVKLIKLNTHEVCLSIGDGANDVSMIQEAHIGIGIYGNEGTQAARSADYAIRQFRHLRRLITIHGRYSLLRNSNLIQYSIYKNAAAFLVQFWMAFYCGYSGQTIYDDWIITLFNIAFTSVPPLFYAIFEKDIDEELIDQYPEVHRLMATGHTFTYSSLFIWMLNAIWHSIIFFFGGVLLVGNEPFFWDGRTTGMRYMGNMASTWAICTVILKCAIITNHWNILVHCGIYGSISCYFLVLLIESFIPALFPRQYKMFPYVFGNLMFWFMFLLVLIVCLVPDIVAKFFQREFYPEDWQILQEARKFKKIDNLNAEMSKRIHPTNTSEMEHADANLEVDV